MRRIRRASVLVAMTAAAALPVVALGPAGAQDAGNCGSGGVAASASQENLGGLAGALVPIVIQAVTPVNAPILSPSAESCNQNSNSINAGGGGGSGGGAGGGSVPVGVGGAATAVSGTPRFTG